MKKQIKYDSAKETLEHIAQVRHAISKVVYVLKKRAQKNEAHRVDLILLANALTTRGDVHDRTKLEPLEKKAFDKVTPLLKETTYGSERFNELKATIKEALDHHYSHNRHHPEHFYNGILGMDLIDFVEMYCDWCASTLRHEDGNIHKSIRINADRFKYNDTIVSIMDNTSRGLKLGKGCSDGAEYGRCVKYYLPEHFGKGVEGMSIPSLIELFVHLSGIVKQKDYEDKCALQRLMLEECEKVGLDSILSTLFINTLSSY